MIQLHVTKKLLEKLPIDDLGFLPVQDKSQWLAEKTEIERNPLSGWHGNILTIQRRNCILLVHDETRFPVFIPCLTKPDFAALDYHFTDCFMNTLLKCGASEQQMENAHKLLEPLQVDSDCSRSVQGTMNQMKKDIEHLIWYDDVDVSQITGNRVGAWLADRPCNVKGQKDCIWPQKGDCR